jgi:hypothetical protein
MAQNDLRLKHICYLFVRENRCDVSIQDPTSIIEPVLLIDGLLPVVILDFEILSTDLGFLID